MAMAMATWDDGGIRAEIISVKEDVRARAAWQSDNNRAHARRIRYRLGLSKPSRTGNSPRPSSPKYVMASRACRTTDGHRYGHLPAERASSLFPHRHHMLMCTVVVVVRWRDEDEGGKQAKAANEAHT